MSASRPDSHVRRYGALLLKLVVSADEKQTTRRREKLTAGVTEAELSPDGKTLAFGLRGRSAQGGAVKDPSNLDLQSHARLDR